MISPDVVNVWTSVPVSDNWPSPPPKPTVLSPTMQFMMAAAEPVLTLAVASRSIVSLVMVSKWLVVANVKPPLTVRPEVPA